MAKNPTLNEVAKAANVSVSTAARVMRNAEYSVDPELKARVIEAAKMIGYVPNLVARRLRGGRQSMIGLVVGNMLDAHYGMIAEVVTEQAEAVHNVVAIVCNMQRDPRLEIKYCRKLLEYRVDGIILTGGGFDQWTHHRELVETVDEIKRAGIAVASLMPRNLDVPLFANDNESLGITIAEHVVAHDHRRVAILLGPQRNEMTMQRMAAMTTFLRNNGVEFTLDYIDSTSEVGALATAKALESDFEFSAMICGSDAIAYGAVSYLKSQQIDVPREMSVIGAGNTRMASLSTPRLTTVELNFDQAGREALDFIVSADAASIGSAGVVVPHSIVRGETFAPARPS